MRYEIWGSDMPAVTLTLDAGESIYTQSGGMSWMSDGIDMQTNARGGFAKSFGRMFSGESIFMATYTSQRPGTTLTIASAMPGTIKALRITPGKDIIAQKNAFLCATQGIDLSIAWSKRVGAGFFGGEGFILQRLSGDGLAFVEIDGSIKEYDLAPGEILKVDTGNVAMFEASVSYEIQTVKGFKNVLFGGEGLFLTVLRGPGRVWLQTMTTAEMAKRLAPFMPTKDND